MGNMNRMTRDEERRKVKRRCDMVRFEKDCDGMPRDELEKRFVILQKMALAISDEEVTTNEQVRIALRDYNKLESDLSHDD